MNVCFDTFGCRLNRAEALEDEAKCVAAGHTVVTEHYDADLIVVRGCSVTSKAQHECEHLIKHLREKYPTTRVHVTGCLPSAHPLLIRPPEGTVPVPMRTARAYMKVQDGCNGGCSFCIVPRFRGKNASVDFTELMDRARRFIDAGYHEIVVTGCNLSLYASGDRHLPDLIAALADLDPDCRIRLGSLEPFPSSEESIHAMAEHANVCRFLHMPVQSGADSILRRMRRPYTAERAEKLMHLARSLMPNLTIGCDMISGFPGENERNHMDSMEFLRRVRASNVHAFPFSRRPGTVASAMDGQIDHEIIVNRAKALAKIGQLFRADQAKQYLDKTVEVIIESKTSNEGWTDEYFWFEEMATIDTPVGGNRRQKMRFRVQEVHEGRLFGVRI